MAPKHKIYCTVNPKSLSLEDRLPEIYGDDIDISSFFNAEKSIYDTYGIQGFESTCREYTVNKINSLIRSFATYYYLESMEINRAISYITQNNFIDKLPIKFSIIFPEELTEEEAISLDSVISYHFLGKTTKKFYSVNERSLSFGVSNFFNTPTLSAILYLVHYCKEQLRKENGFELSTFRDDIFKHIIKKYPKRNVNTENFNVAYAIKELVPISSGWMYKLDTFKDINGVSSYVEKYVDKRNMALFIVKHMEYINKYRFVDTLSNTIVNNLTKLYRSNKITENLISLMEKL